MEPRLLNNGDDGAITNTIMVEFSSDPFASSRGPRAGQPTAQHATEPRSQPLPFLPGRPSAVLLFVIAAHRGTEDLIAGPSNKESANV